MQSCNWVFTINNPTWEDDPLKWSGVKYLVFQKERGESGTDHFQGYVQFRCNKRLSALKALHKEAHWEVRQGTHTQARDYCMKEDTRIDGPWEHGVQPAPALKETLTLAMTDVKEGMTELELAEKYGAIWSRNYRALERYRTLCTNRHRSEKTHVTVLFGPSGTGKSRSAFEGFPGCYTKPKGEWWNGYDSHPHVVVDEFYGWLPWDTLLRVCDRYPLLVQTKGGFANFSPTHIVFTSNKAPEDWYSTQNFAPLLRRLDCIVYIDYDGVADVRRGTPPFPLNTSPSSEPGPRDRVAELFAAYDSMPRNAPVRVPDENAPPPNDRTLQHFFSPRGGL